MISIVIFAGYVAVYTAGYMMGSDQEPVIIEVPNYEFTPIDSSTFSADVTREELTCINYYEAMGWDEWVLGECQYPDGAYWQED